MALCLHSFGFAWAQDATTVMVSDTLTLLNTGPASVYPSVASVNGLFPYIKEITIMFPSLTADADMAGLDLLLESPGGKKVLFHSDLAHNASASSYMDLNYSSIGTKWPTKFPTHFNYWHPVNIDTTSDLFDAPGPGQIVQPFPTLADFLNENPNGDWKLWAIDDEADGSMIQVFGWNLNIQASPDPVCPFVEPPQVSAVSETSAWVSWRGNGSPSKWDVFVGKYPETAVATTIPTFSEWPNDSIWLDNLETNIPYGAYVRSVCDDGSHSDWQNIDFVTKGLECQNAYPLEANQLVHTDSLPIMDSLYFAANCSTFGVIPYPYWLFRFDVSETGEWWLYRTEPSTMAYLSPDTLAECPVADWSCLLPGTPDWTLPLSMGILEGGKSYLLAIEDFWNEPAISVSGCPLISMAFEASQVFTDSLVLHFIGFPEILESDSVEAFFGESPLAVPDEMTPPSSGAQVVMANRTVLVGGLEPNTDYEFFLRKRCSPTNATAWQGPFSAKTQRMCALVQNFSVDTVTYTWADVRFRWEVADSVPNGWYGRICLPGNDPVLNIEKQVSFELFGRDSVHERIQQIGLHQPLQLWLQASCGLDNQPWQGPFDLPAATTPSLRVHDIYCGEYNETLRDPDYVYWSIDGVHTGYLNAISPENPCSFSHYSSGEKIFRYRANATDSVSIQYASRSGTLSTGTSFYVKSGSSAPGIAGWEPLGCWRVQDNPIPFLYPTMKFAVEKDSTYYILADAFESDIFADANFLFSISNCMVNCPPVDTFYKMSSTPTSIILAWNNAVPGGKYIIEHQAYINKPAEFYETTDTLLELTGLDPSLEHRFGVRTVCPGGDAGHEVWNDFEISPNNSFRNTESNRCNPIFVPPGSLDPVGLEAIQLEIPADGDYFLYANQPQLFVYDGAFDLQNPGQNLLAARVGADNSGPKDTTLFLQAGKMLTLVAASSKINKALLKPEQVIFCSSGPAMATFGEALFNKQELAPHGQVAEFPTEGALLQNLVCPDSSGWVNLYAAGADLSDINSDRLLLSLKGYQFPDNFNSGLRLKVAGAPGASHITNPPAGFVTNASGWWEMNRYWNISFLNVQVPEIYMQPTLPVAVRFYYTEQDFQNLKTAIEASGGSLATHEELVFSKISGTHLPQYIAPWLGHPYLPAAATFDAPFGFWPYLNSTEATTDTWQHGSFAGEHFAEMKVRWFSGGGGGATGNGEGPTTATKFVDADLNQYDFRLYPNPAGNKLIIEWRGIDMQNGLVEFVDCLGRNIRQVPHTNSSTSMQISLSDFSAGFYFVKISAGGRLVKSLKFVKL